MAASKDQQQQSVSSSVTAVDDHNNRPNYGFTDYTNRKPGKKITDVINLAELVPTGLD